MPAVRLAAVDPAVRAAVLELAPRDEELVFSGRARDTLPEAEAEPTRHPVVILAGEVPVGFFAFDTGERSAKYAPAGAVGLHSFFIDHRERRHGYARAAMRAAPALAAAWFPAATGLTLSVNVRNAPAVAAYLAAGWRDDGERYLHGDHGPQHVLHAPWPPAN